MAVKRDKTRPAARRVRGSRSAPARPRDEAAALTFSEKELRAVLTEEFEWQWPQVKDFVRRLRRRKESD